MAVLDEKISDLDAVVTPAATDDFAVVQGGNTRRESRAQVHALESGEHLELPQVNEPSTPTLSFGPEGMGFYAVNDNALAVSVAGSRKFLFETGGFRTSVIGGAQILNELASATNPVYIIQGDADSGIGSGADDQLSLIAGGVQVANLTEAAGVVQFIVPTQNDAASPSIAFGNGDTGFYEQTDNVLLCTVAGINRWQWDINFFGASNGARARLLNENPTATNPNIVPAGTDLDTGIGSGGADQLSLIAGALDCINVSNVSSARRVGFYVTAPVALQTGVAVTDVGIHAALVNLGLITA